MRTRLKAMRVWFLALLIGGLALALLWALVGDLPPPTALLSRASAGSTRILDRHGRLLYEVIDPRLGRRTRVALADLPPHVIAAVVAVEDAGYWSHPGVDARALLRAAVQAAREGRVTSGASTITQQLARETLLSPDERGQRTVWRKLREAWLAVRLEQAYDKRTLLEAYLNEVYFGQLAYGIEAAAQTYFAVPARDLDLAQAALLAGLVQSPAALNPLVTPDAARARQAVVLDLMVKAGAATAAEAALAGAEPLRYTSGAGQFLAPHFAVYVRNLLETRYGPDLVNGGGLTVRTTLDLDLQHEVQAAARRQLERLAEVRPDKPDHSVGSAAVVVLDVPTGQILAMLGSPDYWAGRDGAVNVALSLRQPGSAIKPVTYAAAFSHGLAPATVMTDAPTIFVTADGKPYAPQNYDRRWQGPISLRRALATSSNLVAVKVLDAVGIDAFRQTAVALGLPDPPTEPGLALTLGASEVRLLDLTAAYAAIGAAGVYHAPLSILEVHDRAGRVLESQTATEARPALSPQVAYLLTDVLSDNAARIPAFGEGSVLRLDRPAAAKTGTTNDFRDNWTLGYTPDRAVGVWVGNPDGAPMVHVSGISGAGPIWRDVMNVAQRGLPARDFTRPPGLVDVEVCETSGLRATSLCQRRRVETFLQGTEPTERDTSYVSLAIDRPSGLLAAPGCAGPTVERVFRRYPADALDWAAEHGLDLPPTRSCSASDDGRVRSLPQGPTTDDEWWTSAETPALMDDEQRAAEGSRSSVPPGGCALIRCRPSVVEILSPAPGASYALTAELPVSAQRIELRARLAGTVSRVSLLVDGRPFASLTGPPYRAFWTLQPGQHTMQVVALDEKGNKIESDIVTFTVEPELPISWVGR